MSKPTRHEGFTLIELLAVLGILALLVALLAPVLGKARGKATLTSCANSLRQAALIVHDARFNGDDHLMPDVPKASAGIPAAIPAAGLAAHLTRRGCPYCNPPWSPPVYDPPANGSAPPSDIPPEVAVVVNDILWQINEEVACPKAPRNPVNGLDSNAPVRISYGMATAYARGQSQPGQPMLGDSDIELVGQAAEFAFERHAGKANVILVDGSLGPVGHAGLSAVMSPARVP